MQVSSYFNENNRTNLHGELFMHMPDSYIEKMEGSILISYMFVRRQLIALVFI